MSMAITTGWVYATVVEPTLLVPERFQVIASSPEECAEASCALAHEQSGSEWGYDDVDWDAVALRWGCDIRVVPA